MTFEKYWDVLEQSINQFQVSEIETKSEEDRANVELQKQTLRKAILLGREIVALGNTFKATQPALKLSNLPLEVYADSANLPPIEGLLSLAFAERVYLPHIERFKEIEFGFVQRQAAKAFLPLAIQPDSGVTMSEEYSRIFRERIKTYKINNNIKEDVSPKSSLKDQLKSVSDVLLIIQNIDAPNYANATSLLDILDPNYRYETLNDYLAQSHLSRSIKDYLLLRESDNNNFKRNPLGYIFGNSVGRYKPHLILKECTICLLSEKYAIEKKMTQLNQSLIACLKALLHKRKRSFNQSAKSREIAALQQDACNNPGNSEMLISELKTVAAKQRNEERWYASSAALVKKSKDATSLGIFNQFFDENNEAIQLLAEPSSRLSR